MPDVGNKLERKYFQTFIDTTMNGTTPSYKVLGKDLEEFSVDMNPDTEVSKNILGESTFVHNGYETSASADPYYCRQGDELFEALQTIIDNGSQYEGCATTLLEVHLWDAGTTSGTYKAYKQPCYITPTSYGGDTSGYQIPFDVTYIGKKVAGYATLDNNYGATFAASNG